MCTNYGSYIDIYPDSQDTSNYLHMPSDNLNICPLIALDSAGNIKYIKSLIRTEPLIYNGGYASSYISPGGLSIDENASLLFLTYIASSSQPDQYSFHGIELNLCEYMCTFKLNLQTGEYLSHMVFDSNRCNNVFKYFNCIDTRNHHLALTFNVLKMLTLMILRFVIMNMHLFLDIRVLHYMITTFILLILNL